MDNAILPFRLKKRILNFCKQRAPIDTGNLRHNAIYGREWSDKNKFRITYDTRDANYIEYLEESTFKNKDHTKMNRNKYFIQGTYLGLSWMLQKYYRDNKVKQSIIPKKNFKQSEIDSNPKREMVHNKSMSEYRLQREVENNGN